MGRGSRNQRCKQWYGPVEFWSPRQKADFEARNKKGQINMTANDRLGGRVVPTGGVPRWPAPGRRGDHQAPLGSPQRPDDVIVRDSRTTVGREGFNQGNPQPPKT